MGIIDIKPYIEILKNRTENEIGEAILKEAKGYNKTIIDGNYQTLLEYFKGDKYTKSLEAALICFLDYDTSKKLFDKILNFFKIYNIDKDSEYEYLIDHAKEKIKRVSDWKCEDLKLINLSKNKLKCLYASFKYESKWHDSASEDIYKIILDKNNDAMWIKNGHTRIVPNYFIFTGDILYGLYYNHYRHGEQRLFICNYIDLINLHINIENLNNDVLDSVMEKLQEKTFHHQMDEINLTEYFEKGFFYKGPKWWENNLNEISVITNVQMENEYLKIELENITYPYRGCILLDIENKKIVEKVTGKYIIQNDEIIVSNIEGRYTAQNGVWKCRKK